MKPTDKQVVEWARKAGVANAWDINWFDPYYASFAALVAAAEREACAQVAHDTYEGFGANAQGVDFVKERITAGIRARGNMSEGVKYDAGKVRWSLVPEGVMEEYIKVLEFGANKYAPDNWKHVPQATTRYYDAAMRHIDAWWRGEMDDPETGMPHLAHAMCCITFLMWLEAEANKEF